MANIKFSAFTQKVVQTDVDFLVGYTGADNVRISPSTIGQGVYLPLAGGTMTGNILLEDSVKLSIGTSDDFNMFFNGVDTTLQNITGNLNIINKANDKDITLQSDDGAGGVATYLTLDGSTTDAYFSNPGNVGIGTTSPIDKLHLEGGNARIRTTGNTDVELILNPYSNALGTLFQWELVGTGSGGNYNFEFRKAGTTYITVDSGVSGTAGNVGIGTTSPNRSLHVIGQFAIDNSTSPSGGLLVIPDGTSNKVYSRTGNAINSPHPLDFISGSSTSMRIDTAGNVGIGTTSPGRKLEVAGDVGINGYIYHNGDDSRIGFEGNDAIRMYTANSVRLQINASGDVGIGTTSPTEKLEVVGNIRIDSTSAAQFFLDSAAGNDSVINFQEGASQKAKMGYDNSLAGLAIVAGSGPYSTADMVILDGGNVGIGTTSPSFPLDVKSAAIDTVANFESGDASVAVNFVASDNSMQIATSGTDGLLKNNGAGSLRFFNNGSERVRITSAGNVGIGTTSPIAPLTVATPMSSSPTSTFYLDIDGTNTDGGGGQIIFSTSASSGDLTNYNAKITGRRVAGDGGDSELAFWTTLVSDNVASQQRMVITKEGNVGIGTTSNSAEDTNNGVPKLQVTTATAVLGEFPLAARFTTASDPGDDSGVSVLINSGNDRGLMISAGRQTGNVSKVTLNVVKNDGDEIDTITLLQNGSNSSTANVGIGTTSPASKLEVDGGDIEVSDSLNGLILKSPDGTRYRVTVANGGTLTVSAV